jgi:hypothetical protein
MNENPKPSPTYNPWDYKPWWCQPWSILLTGVSLMGGSWLLFHRIWLSAIVAVPVLTWMGFFLLIWPGLMRSAMQSEVEGDR